MGLISKLFGLKIVCRSCGAAGAKDGFGGVKCRNRSCRDYDESYAQMEALAAQADWYVAEPYGSRGGRVRFEDALQVVYLNARGETKTLRCDRASVCRRGARLSLRVEPTGYTISLDPARIENRHEVERLVSESPPRTALPDFSDAVDIEYKNSRGERKTFHAARSSIRTVGAHVSVCVAPKGVRITLARKRIQNPDVVVSS